MNLYSDNFHYRTNIQGYNFSMYDYLNKQYNLIYNTHIILNINKIHLYILYMLFHYDIMYNYVYIVFSIYFIFNRGSNLEYIVDNVLYYSILSSLEYMFGFNLNICLIKLHKFLSYILYILSQYYCYYL